jgi:glycosyltransferase involved in cell wall biosynthesis
MRVLLVSEPGVDGVFRHVEALALFLLAQGHSVDLAYSSVRGSDRLKTLVSHINAAGGETLDMRVGNAPGLSDFSALFRLRTLVSKTQPDAIHAHSSKAGALARALLLTGIKAPVFYTPHAYYGMSGRTGAKASLFTGIERLLGGLGTSITLSDGEFAYAADRLHVPREKLRLIPNPVDTHRFTAASKETKSQRKLELGVPPDALLLGSVGRLAYQKDPLTLYRSFAVAYRQTPNLWLYHLGTGELTEECAALAVELGIQDRIVRKPYLSEPLPFYEAIDVMMLTSRYEGLSFAVLEALACDLPVILSEAPGNVDFLHMDLSHAWSGPVEDHLGLGEAIKRWAVDHAAQRPCNHRALAQSRFSQESCFGAVVKAYESQTNPRFASKTSAA